MLHQLHRNDGGPPIYLTSILADNLPARRLLEHGLPGMPHYRFLGEFVTLVIQHRRGQRSSRETGLDVVSGNDSRVPATLELLNYSNAQYQFAPVYCADDLKLPGLSPADFSLARAPDGKAIACAAIWDRGRSSSDGCGIFGAAAPYAAGDQPGCGAERQAAPASDWKTSFECVYLARCLRIGGCRSHQMFL
jgi:hypothetical protein